MSVCARLIVAGLVQGVFYRVSTREQAASLGLTGFVRNQMDGTVEIVASGEEEALKKLIDWCHDGPAGARVDSVLVEAFEPENLREAEKLALTAQFHIR
ncbi:MAG: acylphosphatase [Candidatus Obscuribacterales bacterium]|nr:acylphosphatase [Candidatus Obscuribacterales bacterium]